MFASPEEIAAMSVRPSFLDKIDKIDPEELEPSTRPSPSRLQASFDDGEPPSVSFPSNPPGTAEEEEAFSVKDEDIVSVLPGDAPRSSSASARRPSGIPGDAPRSSSASARRPSGIPGDAPRSSSASARRPSGIPGDAPRSSSASARRPSGIPGDAPRSSSASARHPSAAFEVPPRSADLAIGEAARRSDRSLGPDLGPVLASLRLADTRDAIIALAIHGLELLARRAAVFAVRKESFRGWACNRELGDEAALRDVSIPQDQPSVLATATATGVYVGPIPETPAHASLLGVMGASSPDVAVVAAKVGERPALILLADELSGDAMLTSRRMEELARAIGAALTRALGQR
jgi:hypothetical protein